MRTANYRDDILWSIAYLLGLDPHKNLDDDQAAALTSFINAWVRRTYDGQDWPEWTPITKFGMANHVVPYSTFPSGLSGEDNRVLIGRVFKVFLNDPMTTPFRPLDTPFTLRPEGVHVGFEHGPFVWIKYIEQPPQFTSDVWIAGRSYNKGELTYAPSVGQCFKSMVNGNQNNDPSEASPQEQPLIVSVVQEAQQPNPGVVGRNKIVRVGLTGSTPGPDPPFTPANGSYWLISVGDIGTGEVVIDSYAGDPLQLDYYPVGALQVFQALGQTFTGNGSKIGIAKLFVAKSGTPTGTMVAKIYTHTGTFGTTGQPGTLLATSDTIDVSQASEFLTETIFHFTGANQFQTVNGTHYCVAVEYTGGDAFNYIFVGLDAITVTHNGNAIQLSSAAWAADNSSDVPFAIVSLASSTVTANGSQTLPEINTALDTALTGLLPTFVNITADNTVPSAPKLLLEDDSDFSVVTAAWKPPTAAASELPVAVVQGFLASVPSHPRVPQITDIVLPPEKVVPLATYKVTLRGADGAEHTIEYQAKTTDSAVQILNGIAQEILDSSDPFFLGVQTTITQTSGTDTLRLITDLEIGVEATLIPIGSQWWKMVLFPFELIDQVVRGAYASALKEEGQADKALPEEQAVPQEQAISAQSVLKNPVDRLTDQIVR